ncbi:MAG: ethanolamine ammonia-lyase subunit EutC [Oscillospiraceae bacterium]|nr:ethanolamine ammonia-lyase subunit EutC [Oscillospiraceae bacterium]
MNDVELRALIERMAAQLAGQAPTPQVKAADYTPLEPMPQETAGEADSPPEGDREALPDLTQTDIRTQYLVENPKNPDAFLALKAQTPARVGLGRAGPRYKTVTMLRMRADHAAAQDSVFSLVDEGFLQAQGYTRVQTLCRSKDEYLKRPDRGRRFDGENQKLLCQALGENPQVVLAVGDGLSSAAIEANAADCVAAIRAGLQTWGLEAGPTLFIKFCRVGASDHIGELTGAQAVCLLVGERPGLVTAESMSAYLTYCPRLGTPESDRTVLSNIHRQGTAAVEAGAHIAELLHTMLDKRASGVRLAQLQREGAQP